MIKKFKKVFHKNIALACYFSILFYFINEIKKSEEKKTIFNFKTVKYISFSLVFF